MVDLGKRLLEAAKQGLTEEVRTLMSNGAPFTTDWLGTSPLHFSALNGHLGTSEVLLRAGISRDARTKVDRTPLHAASQEGHLEIVELLVRNGADMDAKDMLRMTPLHWAVEKGHPVVIEFLLEHGAEVSCQNKFDKSPIDIAMTNGRADLVQILQQNVVEVSTSADDHPFVGEVTEVSAEDAETIAATNSLPSLSGVSGRKPAHAYINTARKKDTGLMYALPDAANAYHHAESTEVLATLAALAEATAGNSTAEGTATSPATTDSDTLKWLESQGITMTMADNTTIVGNTVENGQQLTLTEAGRLALNQIVSKKEGHEVDGEMVTITTADDIEHMTENIVYSTANITESEEEDCGDEPSMKRIKLETVSHSTDIHTHEEEVQGHDIVTEDTEVVTSDLTHGLEDVEDDMNIKLEGVGEYVEEDGVQEYSVETVTETL